MKVLVASVMSAPAALVVASSTGPVHLAAALGSPTLAIHAPWPSCSVPRFGPYAGNGWGLIVGHPQAAGWDRAARRAGADELMASLPPERVQEVARALVEGREPA